MQPTVEVLPSNKTLPKMISLGAKRPDWLKGHPEEVGGVGPGVLSVVAPRKAGRKSKYATPEGRAKIQEAFERYRDMGELRSLSKVAVELNLPDRHVRMWSVKYKWTSQVDRTHPSPAPFAVSNKSLQDRLAEETLYLVRDIIPVAKLKLAEMTTTDPDTGKIILTKSASIAAITQLINTGERCMNVLEKNVNRQKTEKEIESVGSSGNGNGSGGGVIVNVNLLGLVG